MNFDVIIVAIENFVQKIKIYNFSSFQLKFFIKNKSSFKKPYIQIIFRDNIIYINNVARNIYSLITLSTGFLILIGKGVRADTPGINMNSGEFSASLNDRNNVNNAIDLNDVNIYADRHLLFNQELQITNSNILGYNFKNNNESVYNENIYNNIYNSKNIYIVKKGDTLYKIAKTNKISLSQLIEINKHIKNPDLIYPGNKIYLQNISHLQNISNFQDKSVPRLQSILSNGDLNLENINKVNINGNINSDINSNTDKDINNHFELQDNNSKESFAKTIVNEVKTKENINIILEEGNDKLQGNQLNDKLEINKNFNNDFSNNVETSQDKIKDKVKNEIYDDTSESLSKNIFKSQKLLNDEVQVNSEELKSKLQKKYSYKQVDGKSLNNESNFNTNQVNSNLNLNRGLVFSDNLSLGINSTKNKLPINLFQRRIYNTLPSIDGINNGINGSLLDSDSQKTTNSQSDSSYLAYLAETSRYLLPLPEIDFEKMIESPNNESNNEFNKGKAITYIWPTRGVITSKFNEFRGNGRRHKGIDIANAVGTPIYASASGRVLFSGWNSGGYGNLVILEHENGDQTFYAHNLKNHVFRGQKVLQGQWIADMGSTGYSTGSHLHFEVRTHINGNLSHVNPKPLLPKLLIANNTLKNKSF